MRKYRSFADSVERSSVFGMDRHPTAFSARLPSPAARAGGGDSEILSELGAVTLAYRLSCSDTTSEENTEHGCDLRAGQPASSPPERVIALSASTVCAVACVLMGSLR
jgi:hypothetical protein